MVSSHSITVDGTYFPLHSNSNKRLNNTSNPRNQTISLFRKCTNVNQIPQFHAKMIKSYHEQQDPFVLFEFLRLCSSYNSIDYASKVFEQIENPNVYLYTALIDGYVLCGLNFDGVVAYARMMTEGVGPDPYVIASVLKACGSLLALKEGRQIHCQVLKLKLYSNRSIRMKLMELYGKCGEFGDARRVFDEMPNGDVAALTVMISCLLSHGLVNEASAVFNFVKVKDTVCWTSMINGFVRNGEMNKALEFFRKMQREGVRPNEVTIVCVLAACSQLGALELGRWVHSYLGKFNIKLNHYVGSSLVSMYSKCGSLEEAKGVFNKMEERNVVMYNSMIAGLSMHGGETTEAVEMFQSMVLQGLKPNHITFVGVLNACSHGGLADLGLEIFQSMTEDYGIEPSIEHYGCIVDLLGRVGHLEKAYDFIGRMRVAPDHIMLGSLLSACKIHGNAELGEKVAKLLLEGDMADSGTYVLLSNVYASSGKWEKAALVREKMKETGIQKEPGCSAVEIKNEIHEFLLGDIRHPQKDEIYRELEDLNYTLKSQGYSPATEGVLHDIEDEAKERALAIHSERLAICYGLISTKPGTTIRVVNNLRICNDCHTMIKLVTKIKRRKIMVRDRKRFHHFENGSCSCGDYW